MSEKKDLLQKVQYSPLARMLALEESTEPPMMTILDTLEVFEPEPTSPHG